MIAQIRPSALDDWLEAAAAGLPPGELPLVVDVREPVELQTASLRTGPFRLLAIPMGDIPGRLAEIDPGQPVAVLCHHGGRSQRVAQFLAQNGYGQVANIAGGIDAWSQERDAAVPRY